MSLLKLYLKTSRPMFWILAPLDFICGAIFSGYEFRLFFYNPVMLLQMFSLSFPLALFTFGINDIFDHDSDNINPRKNGSKRILTLLEGSAIDQKNYRLIKNGVISCAIIILAISCMTLDPANLFYTISLMLLIFAYSSPPWQFKSRAPLDSITAGLSASFFPFALGVCHAGTPWNMPFQIYLFSLCAMGIHAFSTIMDYTADLQTNSRTFAVKFGKRWAALFSAVTILIALLTIQTILLRSFAILYLLLFCLNAVFISEKFARITYVFIYSSVLSLSVFWIFKNL